MAAEVYGEDDEDPAVAVGIRYKLGGDASLYARVGTRDGETFGAIGVAFEFEPD